MRRFALLLPPLFVAGIAAAAVSSVGSSASRDRTAEAATSSRFTLRRTVQATPSGNYLMGGFVRINYVPGRSRFILTFNTKLNQAEGGCADFAYAYKEYTADLEETTNKGVISCHAITDTGSLLVGDDFYLVSMESQAAGHGWQMARYDAVTWATKASFFYPLTGYPREGEADPMLAYVNGQIDISSQYNDNPTGTPPGLTEGAATHHQFFTTDLQFIGKRVLSDTPHIYAGGLIYLDGVYHFVTAKAYLGDMVVMRHDQNWNHLGVKTLKEKAFFPEGLAFDGSTFYVSYIDTSQRAGPTSLPLYQNVRLAAFDSNWNLLEDIAVTSFTPQDYKQPGRPWLILRDNRLYVSYDQDTVDPVTGQEKLQGQAFVKIYELSTASTACTSFAISLASASPTAADGSQSVTVTGVPAGCSGGSWTASGNGSWLTVSPASGTGSGSVTVSWSENTSTSARNGTATIAGSSFSVSQAAASTTTLNNDWVPCGPPGGASGGPGEDVGHPERMRVLMAHSTDGLHFQRSTSESARLLLDQADIPDAIVLPSGRILVYLIADCRDHTPFGGTKDKGLGVAISDAKGAPGSWIFKDVITDWAAHGLGPPMDPNVVLWKPQENLLRLFVTEVLGGVLSTYSYTSTDGFTFSYEGLRYNPGVNFLDPENFRFGDSNWQIITASDNGYAISSDDGSTFTNAGSFSNHVTSPSNYRGVPADISVTRTPGVYRIFASANGSPTSMGNIESLQSTASPWTSWKLEGTVLEELPGMESCGITCPTVVRLADDDWLMFYATINPNCVCGGQGPLFHCSPPTAALTCSVFTISPASASATASAGSKTVTVTGWPSGCSGGSWTASGNGSWITVSPASGSGPGSVAVSWTPNTSTARSGNATIAGNTFEVNQAGTTPGDFNGDGRASMAVYRPTSGVWHALSPGGSFSASEWGVAGDLPVPAAYTGSGVTNVAVFRPSAGIWYVKGSLPASWGVSTDVPVPADFDGDGKADPAVFRPAAGTWFVRKSGGGSTSMNWGQVGDTPVAGDFDGDHMADFAVVRRSGGVLVWFVLKSQSGYSSQDAVQWGVDGDLPAPADYDGDGKTDIAVFRPSTGVWFIRRSSDGGVTTRQWGALLDVPQPADYDGDGKADVAVYRPGTGTWWVINSSDGTVTSRSWGIPGDIPVTAPRY